MYTPIPQTKTQTTNDRNLASLARFTTSEITLDGLNNAVRDIATLVRQAHDKVMLDPQEARGFLREAVTLLEPLAAVETKQSPTFAVGGLAPWQARNVIAYIDVNVGSSIRIESLATLCRLSSSHFHRAFKSTFAETPYNYILRQRMELACKLMTESDEPLSQIALDCGMNDQSHLSNMFRRTFGVTPNAWRRHQASQH